MSQSDFPLSLFKTFDKYKSVTKGEIIFKDGDPGDFMYLIRSGSVSLMKGNTVLETVEPNGLFGELALLDSTPRAASAVATSDCLLIPIDSKWFFFMVEETPYFARHVMKLMADRLRAITKIKVGQGV